MKPGYVWARCSLKKLISESNSSSQQTYIVTAPIEWPTPIIFFFEDGEAANLAVMN